MIWPFRARKSADAGKGEPDEPRLFDPQEAVQYPNHARASTAHIFPGYGVVDPGRVTHEETLRLAAVWAAVNVIASALASSDWDVFEKGPDGKRVDRSSSALWRLLNVAPNAEMTAFAFREAMVIQALLFGNAYAEIQRNMTGAPAVVTPIDPERCKLERDESGQLVLRVQNSSGGPVHLPYEDVFHLQGPSLDGLAGYDLVLMALRPFSVGIAMERYSSAYFNNGTALGGVLSTEQNLTADQRKDLQDSIDKRHKGPENAFKFLIAGGGMKFQGFAADPKTAQFIEQRHFIIEEVCRFFNVPPHKLHHNVRSTFNNIEHLGIDFVRSCLTPWAERLRQEADKKLTPRRNPHLRTRIDLAWQAEGDAQSRAQVDSTLVNSGLATRNERRQMRGLNSHPDRNADVLTVQTAMAPIDALTPMETQDSEDISENPE